MVMVVMVIVVVVIVVISGCCVPVIVTMVVMVFICHSNMAWLISRTAYCQNTTSAHPTSAEVAGKYVDLGSDFR
jgi:hypothetical protein